MPRRQRGHVQQQHVLDVALQHAALDRGADGDDLIRVDVARGLLAEELLHRSMTLGMRVMPPTRITSSISPAVSAGILQRLLAGLERARRSGRRPALSSFARVSFITRCFGPEASAVMKGRLISVSLEDDSSIFAFSAASFSRCRASLSPRRSMPCSLLELVRQVVDDARVEVLAAQEGVAVGRLHLEDAVADLEDRDVEGAAAEVVDRDRCRPSSGPCRRRARPPSAR